MVKIVCSNLGRASYVGCSTYTCAEKCCIDNIGQGYSLGVWKYCTDILYTHRQTKCGTRLKRRKIITKVRPPCATLQDRRCLLVAQDFFKGVHFSKG